MLSLFLTTHHSPLTTHHPQSTVVYVAIQSLPQEAEDEARVKFAAGARCDHPGLCHVYKWCNTGPEVRRKNATFGSETYPFQLAP